VQSILSFLLHWAVTALSLWVVARLFKGIAFDSTRSLVLAALLLGLANAIVRPILIVLTLPLTLVTFGLFLLVINALMLLLVARLVRGFRINGFGTAFFAGVAVWLLSLVFGALASHIDTPSRQVPMEAPGGSNWV
jgi:putative membrane protein